MQDGCLVVCAQTANQLYLSQVLMRVERDVQLAGASLPRSADRRVIYAKIDQVQPVALR